MATWTLADIRQKVRQVTGRLSSNELTTTRLDEYINQYYQFTFPAELKLERKYTFYEFLTEANQQYYDMPSTFTNVVPPAKIDNLDLLWYQSPPSFEKENPEQYTLGVEWTGDGATTAFSTTVTGFPILPGTTIVSDGVETFSDSNQDYTTSNVNLGSTGAGTGTVNYSTGVVSVNFAVAPANGQDINLSYVIFKAGRPTAVLFFNEQFKFFPVPDQAYRFKVQGYQIVTPLVNATDTPDLEQWGPCIAYGAARDICADLAEMDRYQEITALYKEQLAYVLKRTNQNLLNTRAAPMF